MSHPVELSQAAQAALVKLRHARDRTAYYREIEEQSRAMIEAELGDATMLRPSTASKSSRGRT